MLILHDKSLLWYSIFHNGGDFVGMHKNIALSFDGLPSPPLPYWRFAPPTEKSKESPFGTDEGRFLISLSALRYPRRLRPQNTL